MKKKEETKALKQTIYSVEIYQTLDLLERQLNFYRQSEGVMKKLYRIHREFDAISKVLSDLRFRIENVTKEE